MLLLAALLPVFVIVERALHAGGLFVEEVCDVPEYVVEIGLNSTKLEGMDVASALRSTDAQAESLARLTGICAASIKDGLSIMVAVLIELGSGLGLWVTTAGTGQGQAKQAATYGGGGPERGNARHSVSCDSTREVARLR